MSILIKERQGAKDWLGEAVLDAFDVAAGRAALRLYQPAASTHISKARKVLQVSERIMRALGAADGAQELAVKAIAAAHAGTVLAVVSRLDYALLKITKGRIVEPEALQLLHLLDAEARSFVKETSLQ